MTTHSIEGQARGRIELGLKRLAGEYPFHVKVLERLDVHCDPSVGTMGVMLSGNGVRLLYAPEFTLGLSVDMLGGVLLHEVHHVVFGHLLADRTRFSDRWARIVAEEVTVNEFIREPLPEGVIRLEQFPLLPANESTDLRYQRLEREANRMAVWALSGAGGGQGEVPTDSQSFPGRRTGVIPDNHQVREESAMDGELAASILREIVHDAAIEAGAQNVPPYLRGRLRGMGIGHVPGNTELALTGGQRGHLNWVRLLRKFMGRHFIVRPDFRWPSRRVPDLLGIVPGRRRGGPRPRVMAVLDTSASLTRELLELISAELARLAADFEVTVVECDVAIQRVYRYRPILSVRGRGGTSFVPPFEPAFLAHHKPDALVYFTDGGGRAPRKPPPVPVLWCLTPNGATPAKWGESVQMSTMATQNSTGRP